MIREKINELLFERELSKGFKEELVSADIFLLESLAFISGIKSVDFGNGPKVCDIVGILDAEGEKFYPLFTDDVYGIMKKNHDEKINPDRFNEDDVGNLFISNMKKFNISSLKGWETSQYYNEYKRLKCKLLSSQFYKDKCNVKQKH